MKRHIAIHLLGGNMSKAARALGCSPQAVSKWPVDGDDNIMSKPIVDAVLAALARAKYAHYKAGLDGEPFNISDEHMLDDLFVLPSHANQ